MRAINDWALRAVLVIVGSPMLIMAALIAAGYGLVFIPLKTLEVISRFKFNGFQSNLRSHFVERPRDRLSSPQLNVKV